MPQTPERKKQYAKERAATPHGRALLRAASKRWVERHPERQAAFARDWQVRNPERLTENARVYRDRNRDAVRIRQRVRSARKRVGACAWADQKKIETIYLIAAFLTVRTGIAYVVDHFYPISGKTCCGLHVETNLCVITQAANRRKGNKVPA